CPAGRSHLSRAHRRHKASRFTAAFAAQPTTRKVDPAACLVPIETAFACLRLYLVWTAKNDRQPCSTGLAQSCHNLGCFPQPGGTQAKHANYGRRVGAGSRDAAARSSAIRRHRGLQDPRMGPEISSTSMIAFAATTRAGHGPCSIVRNPHCRFTLVGAADIGMASGSPACGNVLCSSSTFACHSMTNAHKPATRSIALAVCADAPTAD